MPIFHEILGTFLNPKTDYCVICQTICVITKKNAQPISTKFQELLNLYENAIRLTSNVVAVLLAVALMYSQIQYHPNRPTYAL